MTKFWAFFIYKHNFTILLGIVLTLGGLVAVAVIPKESSPEIQIPIGIVTTALPGASAEDVEALITNVIEDAVLGIENVNTVTSSSGDGVSSITVEFAAKADIDRSIQLLKDEVDEIKPELPEDALDPVVSDVNLADQPILIISIAGALAPAELTTLGEALSDEIERIRGVSSVSVSGVREREVTVVVSQAKLAQYNMTLGAVTEAIRTAGIASPAGSITVNGVRYPIRMEAGIDTASDVSSVVITNAEGRVVYVQDVAEVFDGLSDPRSISRVSVDGQPSEPALTLQVYKSRGGNILETGSAVKNRIEELRGTLLSGTETAITYDAADYIEKDLVKLSRVGIETVLLVVGILLITIGWRESLVAAASIPLSFLIAFIGLAASGNTINFISLFSLILAIGILVDSGIVVVEAIHTKLVRLGDKRKAAIETIKEYAWPLTAGTLTTVAVFVPLFFLSGIVGKYVASIPFTVIFVLLASIFVALGLVPLIAMYVVRKEQSKIETRQEAWNEKAKEWYASWLRGMLTNRRRGNRFMVLMVGLFIVSLSLPVTGLVKTIFFPSEDMEFIFIEIEKPVGTALEVTDLAVREVEEYLYDDERIVSFVADVGAGSAFSGNMQTGTHIGSISINLTDNREEMSSEIVSDIREKLADFTTAEITVSEPTNGPPTGAAISVTFSGNDLEALSTASDIGARILSQIDGVANIDTSTRDDGAEFVIRIDAEKAATLGVSTQAARDTIRTALFGTDAADFREGSTDIEIRTKLNLNPQYRDPSETADVSIEAVRGLLIEGAQGAVPLATIADITYEPASAVIRHEDGVRIATLTGDTTADGNALQITARYLEQMEQEELPTGVTMSTGGESEDVNQSFIEMILALLAGAALMLAILVLEFNSFRHSLYLLLIIPLSLVGVLFGLLITGSPLSFPSMLGVIALSGVIINHAIILMDSIARLSETHSAEKNLTDIIVEASAMRLRPIVLTTITTCVGMIPLALSAGMWGPLAFAIMFGLAWSLLLTLALLPILYHRAPGKDIESKYNHA